MHESRCRGKTCAAFAQYSYGSVCACLVLQAARTFFKSAAVMMKDGNGGRRKGWCIDKVRLLLQGKRTPVVTG